MTGHFLFRRLSSVVSRSRRFLGAHVPASAWTFATAPRPVSARAGAPEGGVRTLGHLFPRSVSHLSTSVPSNHGTYGYDGSIRTLNNLHGSSSHLRTTSNLTTGYEDGMRTINNLYHGVGARPSMAVPNNCVINSCAANVVLRSYAAPKASHPITGMPSVITNCMKRTFASSSSFKEDTSWRATFKAWEAERELEDAASEAEWKAEILASKSEWKALGAKLAADRTAFRKVISVMLCVWGVIGFYWIPTSRCSKIKSDSCGAPSYGIKNLE